MDASTLVGLLNDQAYDEGREKMLNSLMKVIPVLTVTDLLGIVKCYAYDEGKVSATNQLWNNKKLTFNSNAQIITMILNQMAYDPGRDSVLAVISQLKPTITLDEMNAMMNTYAYDEGKIYAFQLFANRNLINKMTTQTILYGLSLFAYDPARFTYLEKTQQGLDVMETSYSLDNLLSKFAYDHPKVLQMVKEKVKLNSDDLCRLISEKSDGETNFIHLCKEFKIPSELIEKHKIATQKETVVSIGKTHGISVHMKGNKQYIEVGGYEPGSVVNVNGITITF